MDLAARGLSIMDKELKKEPSVLDCMKRVFDEWTEPEPNLIEPNLLIVPPALAEAAESVFYGKFFDEPKPTLDEIIDKQIAKLKGDSHAKGD